MANTSVFAIYATKDQVERTVDALRNLGFRATDISVLWPENEGSKDLGHELHSKAPEGATAGAGTGALIGGTLGWLAGIGALAIPGIGPLVAAGPIVAALAGAGAAGALGGITGALIGYGLPEYEAKRYEGRVRKGGILLSVHADNKEWANKAKQVLTQSGGEFISSADEPKGDFANADRPTARI
ncbi:MAG TPA: hypothetical protein VN700_07550 [Vicinamibacterales bacterium]|nr:hypothetical protein [Vicinamibacterales bacterium]